MKYRVLVEQDEDGMFVAEVPSLPGCISQGETRTDALVNIQEAIRAYVGMTEDRIVRWEYTYLNVYGLSTQKVVAELNRLGSEGWEAVALIEFEGVASAFYLKRPLVEA